MELSKIPKEYSRILLYLFSFIKNPIKEIKQVSDFSLVHIIIVQAILSMMSGALSGIVDHSIINFFLGLILFPIVTILVSITATAFFYYFYLFGIGQKIDYEKAYTVIFLTTLPILFFHVVSSVIPPIDLIGYLMAAFLLIVGLVENFLVPRKLTTRLVFSIFFILVILWIVQLLQSESSSSQLDKEQGSYSLPKED